MQQNLHIPHLHVFHRFLRDFLSAMRFYDSFQVLFFLFGEIVLLQHRLRREKLHGFGFDFIQFQVVFATTLQGSIDQHHFRRRERGEELGGEIGRQQ